MVDYEEGNFYLLVTQCPLTWSARVIRRLIPLAKVGRCFTLSFLTAEDREESYKQLVAMENVEVDFSTEKNLYKTFSAVTNRIRNGEKQLKNKCSVCGDLTILRCQPCGIPYCRNECQISDWPKHALVCNIPNLSLQELEEDFTAISQPIWNGKKHPKKMCSMCGELTILSCQRCGVLYCGKECQMSDWHSHALFCNIPNLSLRKNKFGGSIASDMMHSGIVIETGDSVMASDQSVSSFSNLPIQHKEEHELMPQKESMVKQPSPLQSETNNDMILPIEQKKENESLPQKENMVSDIKMQPIETQTLLRIYVTDLSMLDDNKITFIPLSELDEFNQQLEKFTAYCDDCPSINYSPIQNELCLAKYGDEWYRAFCLNILDDDIFELKLLDTGKVEKVNTLNIRKIVKTFMMDCKSVTGILTARGDELVETKKLLHTNTLCTVIVDDLNNFKEIPTPYNVTVNFNLEI